MAWVTSNLVQNTFSSLFVQNGDGLRVSEDCLAILEEILRKLTSEDVNLRSFRRAIGFGQNIQKNLIPLLLYVRDETQIKDATKIIDTTIKIFVNLTIPVEYLLPIEAVSRTEVGKHTIFELNKLLTSSKEVFTDGRNTKALVDHMKFLVEVDSQLEFEQCDSINNCLLLLRNILHIPESKSPASNGSSSPFSMQNQIIWNLFTQSLDKIIIYLMSCPQKMYWGVTMVQLIAMMYKDQHVGNLQKLLNLWLETSYSDSSEDNESNTSPPEQGSEDSSPVITSDPTSDSSDNGNYTTNHSNISNKATVNSERMKCSTNEVVRAVQNRSKSLADMKRNESTETENSTSSGVSSMGHSMESNDSPSESTVPHTDTNNVIAKKVSTVRPSSQSEISDCGYVTQVENQESISTSSNDDDQPLQKPVHQKPHSFQKSRYSTSKNRATTALEKKELRRKKLVKRRKTNIINMKGLLHHLPTDEDIANILKEFTVDFLLKGYGTLVNDLHSQLLTNIHFQIDTSHFFWLVTYFLKFAIQLELDPEHISPVLSYEILSYLIFQGVWVYEELEISCTIPDIDLKSCLRRLHLVVTAIREFLQGIEAYQKMIHLSDADKDQLAKLQRQIGEMDDLKMLFVLLLRQYNPNMQSKQYLQDLILTNHNFLLFLENYSSINNQQFSLVNHLKQFATVDIMRQYGLLLESFKENGEFVNNCIFTMMHHIGGDLQNISSLFQPSILKTFSQIWDTDYELCDDWSDLIEYVIHKFINNPSSHCVENANTSVNIENSNKDSKEIDHLSNSEYTQTEWTREEKENLLKYYNQNRESSDTITKITEKYEESGMRYKTPDSVIHELLEQHIISENEYNDLTNNNKIEKTESDEKIFENSTLENLKDDELIDNDIKVLRDFLFKERKGKFLIWLQSVLLEACYVKLVLTNSEEYPDNKMEPTVYYFAMLSLPIPVIPWTSSQADVLKHQPFVLLLHKLGFHMPVETGKIFVRIPNFWTADYIFSVAQQLGPIQTAELKFDVNKLKSTSACQSTEVKSNIPSPYFDSTRFSMIELKQTPSVVRYTPLPNSPEWIQNISKTRNTSTTDTTPSSRRLSIVIPDTEVLSCNISPPELAIVERSDLFSQKGSVLNMECNLHETDLDDLERNSYCDTASVASDLTRMCVSDEEDKGILIINGSDKKC